MTADDIRRLEELALVVLADASLVIVDRCAHTQERVEVRAVHDEFAALLVRAVAQLRREAQ